jgi:GT2 family glycosyltransferase
VEPRLSFIVPVKNDAARLDVCLSSIAKNEQPGTTLEMIVIDNGSSDGSPGVARRHGATVLEIGQGKVSLLRNHGAVSSTGDILAFVDADNEIDGGWVAAARENLRQPGVGATGALYRSPRGGTWVQRAYGLLRGRSTNRQATQWLGSGNLAVTRRAFEAIKGFDVTLEACEDVDFCARLRAAGFTLLSDPRLGSVHHGDPLTLRSLFIGEMWRGRDNLRVSFRRPIDWNGVPSALLPVLDLAMLVVLVVSLVGLAAGWPGARIALATALAAIVLGALLRTWRARRGEQVAVGAVLQLFAVVLVYNTARALAVVARTPHRNAHSAVATATS